MKNSKQFLYFIALFFATFTFGQDVKKDSIVNKNKPLFVVDGKILNIEETEFSDLNPNEIESIDVLKGKAAFDIYGDKAKNGVLLIKTKNINNIELKKMLEKSDIEVTIFGTITDCENRPLSGANVKIINTNKSTQADFDGKFSIKCNKSDILKFSYIGMLSKSIQVKELQNIDIILKALPFDEENVIRIAKPIIYLYPTQKSDITLQIETTGKLKTTFPKYEQKWDLSVESDGKIFDKISKRFYNSLFWDGEFHFPKEHFQYKDGFVVSKNNLTSFLIEKLEYLGLNTNETNDFVQYWLPILEKNETNFIHFYVNDAYKVVSTNIVTPKPDTEIRVYMEFYKLNEKINIPTQKLQPTFRKGFTLVEWGGADVSNFRVDSF